MSVSGDRFSVPRIILLGLTAGMLGVAQPGAAADDHREVAVWTPHELRFVYMGFTTHYSCDGLRENIKSVLLQLGARESDLRVRSFGCTRGLGVPEPAPGVIANFSSLVPSQEHATTRTATPAVAAEWRTAELKLGKGALEHAGQCELIEQVRQKVLPLFTFRNLDFRSDCFPHQLTISGARLRVDVLKPLHKSRHGD